MTHPPLLEVEGLTLSLPNADGGRGHAIRDVCFRLEAGAVLAVLGSSGAGKSLLLRAIAGLLPRGIEQTAGAIRLNGAPLQARDLGAEVAWLSQDTEAALNPLMRLESQLLRGRSRVAPAPRRAHFHALARELGLAPELATRFPHELSGGERERLALAAALSARPRLLLADEPGHATDLPGLVRSLGLLRRACSGHDDATSPPLAVVLVTHDRDVARALAQETLVLHEGIPVSYGHDPHGQDPPEATPPHAPHTPPTHTSGGQLLELENLTRRRGTHAAPNRLNATLSRGETLALLGPSGAGKTTTARIIAGLEAPSSGRLRLFAPNLEGTFPARPAWHARVQYVFQDPWRSLHPARRIGDALEDGLKNLSRRATSDERRARVRALLEEMELPPDTDTRRPHRLSGGERQRVALARALLLEPELLLADEITAFLDTTTAWRILALLKTRVRARGTAVVFITHDLRRAAAFAENTLVLDHGRAVEHAPTSTLLRTPQSATAQSLTAAARTLGGKDVF